MYKCLWLIVHWQLQRTLQWHPWHACPEPFSTSHGVQWSLWQETATSAVTAWSLVLLWSDVGEQNVQKILFSEKERSHKTSRSHIRGSLITETIACSLEHWVKCRGLKGTPAKINVGFKCSFFQEDNNATVYLGVKHMLTELLEPKVGTIWCIYAI